ncbi:MAG TPA: hypothetical protein VHQ22_12340 [Terriglobales bacterium]|jgi:Flp pilus assembly protein CpaB|nr:hypothetical protein [Terriglobales bacterium]
MIRKLAEKVWAAVQKESRVAHTVVLKLKTSDFKILTRSHTNPSPPSSCEELTTIALALRARVDATSGRRFRLVGTGLSNFGEPELAGTQQILFAPTMTANKEGSRLQTVNLNGAYVAGSNHRMSSCRQKLGTLLPNTE